MFAGHIGAALVIARAERRIPVGAFVVAALLLDIVLWSLVLLGQEAVTIPAHFARTHQPEFVFPFSHGLLASLVWSALAGALGFMAWSRLGPSRFRAAALIAAAVFSHWLLDALVHAPELPLAGAGSAKLGLGLWQHLPAALAVEALLVAAGLWLFVSGAALSAARKSWLVALVLALLAFTIAGMTVAPPPPSATAMAASSLLTIVAVCALVGWLARPARGSAGR